MLRTGIVLNVVLAPWYTLVKLNFWGVPIILLVCFFLLGVELIDSVIEEPFGSEREDLALDRYCDRVPGARSCSAHASPKSPSISSIVVPCASRAAMLLLCWQGEVSPSQPAGLPCPTEQILRNFAFGPARRPRRAGVLCNPARRGGGSDACDSRTNAV